MITLIMYIITDGKMVGKGDSTSKISISLFPTSFMKYYEI